MNLEVLGNYLLELTASLGGKLIAAIVVLFVGVKIIKWCKKILKESSKLDKIEGSLRSFMVSFSTIALYAVLIVTIAMILGVPVTSFITILASCGVAVGLALQGALSNFAGGIMILLFKPFRVGDFIEAAGECGTVSEVSVVYTVLLTPDNKRITVPNGTLTNSVIKNYSAENIRRVDFTFTASYDNDVEKVKSVIAKVVSSHPLALKDPAPFVRLSKHADSALEYTARAWCKGADYWTVNFDVIEGVKKAFDENGISIPYQQIDIHVNKD